GHTVKDRGAAVPRGSFTTAGRVVAPCSMTPLAGIAPGLADNLVRRAAHVGINARRRLVLLAPETPFNQAHIRNMTLVTE
ncbi:flavoprotein, partial [Variovorax sp. CT11-76]